MNTFQSNKYAVNLIERKTYLQINFADPIWMRDCDAEGQRPLQTSIR